MIRIPIFVIGGLIVDPAPFEDLSAKTVVTGLLLMKAGRGEAGEVHPLVRHRFTIGGD